VRAVAFDWSLDVAIAPAGAMARIASAINRPKKRAFGVLKTENEFVGFIRDDTFEIWERQKRAIHGRGTVRGLRGGSRIELRLALRGPTKVLVGTFFALYTLVAAGIATQPPRPEISIEEIAISLVGAALLAVIFAASAAQQRADLRRLLERTFSEVPRL
jgi:hypothetical protein